MRIAGDLSETGRLINGIGHFASWNFQLGKILRFDLQEVDLLSSFEFLGYVVFCRTIQTGSPKKKLPAENLVRSSADAELKRTILPKISAITNLNMAFQISGFILELSGTLNVYSPTTPRSASS